MTKQILSILLVLTIAVVTKGQVVDVAPSGMKNPLPVEGGSIKEKIDSITPLNDLIGRLEKPWEFVETGKMYWIGYTTDMFSIAEHGDEAIGRLMTFIKTTTNTHAQLGAICTIHLIGINSTIDDRYTETFTNKSARAALISLLYEKRFEQDNMDFLLRDPWQSDVPELFDVMKKSKSSCWYIICSLSSYKIPGLPLENPKIPNDIANIVFEIPEEDAKQQFISEPLLHTSLQAINDLKNKNIVVDKSLLKGELLGNTRYEFPIKELQNGKKGMTIGEFFNSMAPNKIRCYVENGVLYISTAEKAKQALLKWWNAQPTSYKSQFTQDKKLQ